MGSDRDQLLSFGFTADRVDWALKATAGRGLQPALDFLFENEGKDVPSDLSAVSEQKAPAQPSGMDVDEDDDDDAALKAALKMSTGASGSGEASSDAAGRGGSEAVAQSIKCIQCGKIFRDTTLANFHAEKSGHDQFEESAEAVKPLTEEEKKERLAELRQRAMEKKALKSVEEAKEAKANEFIRRKAGQDRGAALEDMQLKEANREAEKKKQEKIEEAKARAAIKAKIEADKRERAEKAAREKAIREGREYIPGGATPAAASSSAAASAAPSAAAQAGVKGSEYKDTRLQIRLASGGPPLTTTLPSNSTLREVAEFVAGQSLSFDVDTVSFAMTFPRKTFTRADFGKTLKDLGLTPSAVLIAS